MKTTAKSFFLLFFDLVTYVHRILSPVSDNDHAGFLSRGSIYRDHCNMGRSDVRAPNSFPRF